MIGVRGRGEPDITYVIWSRRERSRHSLHGCLTGSSGRITHIGMYNSLGRHSPRRRPGGIKGRSPTNQEWHPRSRGSGKKGRSSWFHRRRGTWMNCLRVRCSGRLIHGKDRFATVFRNGSSYLTTSLIMVQITWRLNFLNFGLRWCRVGGAFSLTFHLESLGKLRKDLIQ